MSLADRQREGFDNRLRKIRKGGSNTMGHLEIGPRDEVRAAKGKKAKNTVRVKSKRKKNVSIGEGSTVTLSILALFFGFLSMFVGQAAGFHFFEEGGLVPVEAPLPLLEPYLQYTPFLVGGLLALAFGWTFRMLSGIRFVSLAGAFVATFYYKTDLIQSLPGLYAGFFSKEYVNAVLAAV